VLDSLEFMVSVDTYLNETTRHADVILPPTDSARVGHYDFSFLALAVRNIAVYSPPSLPPDPGAMDECEILARLTLIAEGKGADADPAAHDEALLSATLGKGDVDRAEISGDSPAERLLDAALRAGAYGLTLDELKAAPHGIDLGPLEPRIPGVLRTVSGKVELCPAPIVGDTERLRAALADPAPEFVLVGRRHLRSNNSWMHNVTVLVKGKARCTLQMHPDDAAKLALVDGSPARVTSSAGEVVAPVEVTDSVLPGVVSLPHGWGHDRPGTRMAVAQAHAGVNSNVLTDELALDPLSGNAVLNAIPVTVEAAG
jgi:anaerobic selenocysteine-containing dehydrogenase